MHDDQQHLQGLKKEHRQTYYVFQHGLTLQRNWLPMINYIDLTMGNMSFQLSQEVGLTHLIGRNGMPHVKARVKEDLFCGPRTWNLYWDGADVGSSFHFHFNVRRKLQEQNHQPSFVSIININITIIISCAPPVVLALPSRWRWIVLNHATTLMEGTPGAGLDWIMLNCDKLVCSVQNAWPKLVILHTKLQQFEAENILVIPPTWPVYHLASPGWYTLALKRAPAVAMVLNHTYGEGLELVTWEC